ncbi:peptidoglycan-binding protein LysM [Granulicatella sp. HMSC30F09]|jgi:lysM domain protein|nr:peptidoglycan-binding protein LysM [Granulicatella sp. HMSC31F03]OFT80080.1 peptidoglycan-binding protein LysM [Granulicatella sp. HMSC30F09]
MRTRFLNSIKESKVGKENMKPIKKRLMMVTASLALFGYAGFTANSASANEVEWTARTVEQVKQDVKKDDKGVQEYTIKWGDTLSVISEATGASLDSLVQVNEIQNANLIYPGTVLRFSADQKEVTVNNGSQEHSYRVQDNKEVKEVEKSEATTSASNETAQATQATETTQAAQTTQAASSSQNGYYLTVEATAYSYNEAGLSSYTADGTNLVNEPNVIAVDPSVIPLGSYVEIPGYGIFRAADTGGAIYGNRIDVHLVNLNDVYNFGRRTITIRVLQ